MADRQTAKPARRKKAHPSEPEVIDRAMRDKYEAWWGTLPRTEAEIADCLK